MVDFKEELKKYLKEQNQLVQIQETFTDSQFTIMITFNQMKYMQAHLYSPDENKADAENETYCRLLMELHITPEQREARKAYMDQWMFNVQHGTGDANGETIPSNKQVAERLRINKDA